MGGVGDGDGDEQMDEFEESMGDEAADDDDEDVECGDERLDAKRDTFGFGFDEGGGRDDDGGGDDFIMDDVRDAIDASNSLFMFMSS